MTGVWVLPKLLARPQAIVALVVCGLLLVMGFLLAFFDPKAPASLAYVLQIFISFGASTILGRGVLELQHASFAWALPQVHRRIRVELVALSWLVVLPIPLVVGYLVGPKDAVFLLCFGWGIITTFLRVACGTHMIWTLVTQGLAFCLWIFYINRLTAPDRFSSLSWYWPLAFLVLGTAHLVFLLSKGEARRMPFRKLVRGGWGWGWAGGEQRWEARRRRARGSEFHTGLPGRFVGVIGGVKATLAEWRGRHRGSRASTTAVAAFLGLTVCFFTLAFMAPANNSLQRAGWPSGSPFSLSGWQGATRYLVGEQAGGGSVSWLLAFFVLSCLAIFVTPRLGLARRYPQSRSRIADIQFLSSLLGMVYFLGGAVGLVGLAALGAGLSGQAIDASWVRSGLWVLGLWTALIPLGQRIWLAVSREGWAAHVAVFWGALLASVTSIAGVLRPSDLPLTLELAILVPAIALSQALYWRALRSYYRHCDLFREAQEPAP